MSHPLEMIRHPLLNPLRPSALVAALLAAACSHPDDVQVRLTRLKNVEAAAIDWITVFSGADKRSLDLSPGEIERVVLRPNGERPDVILTFRVNGEPRSWQGPPLARGSGYAVALIMDGNGVVSEAHCEMPCELQ